MRQEMQRRLVTTVLERLGCFGLWQDLACAARVDECQAEAAEFRTQRVVSTCHDTKRQTSYPPLL